jgi:hypothetical protein
LTALSDGGAVVAATEERSDVLTWSDRGGRPVGEVKLRMSSPSRLALTPDGKLAIAGGEPAKAK